MKLWQEKASLDSLVEAFTVGDDRELDLLLAKYDVAGNRAHARMLAEVGLLQPEAADLLDAELTKIDATIDAGRFEIEHGVEDVHSQIELLLTRELGDTGKRIHTARSRNDQVLTDLRLFFRAELRAIAGLMRGLFSCCLQLSERHQAIAMPGYTHSQIAMPSSFGLWFGCFAESLIDDLRQLIATYQTVNQNPLGSAAGYGSSFPIDRQHTTELLEFDDLCYNVVYAQFGRGRTELSVAFSLSMLATTLNKLASDVVLFSSGNYKFLRLPDHLTTGSSIMPHKKNPDVFELIRARCNQLQSLPIEINLLITNLMTGYHRDFQLLKERLFPALERTRTMLALLIEVLPQLEPTTDILSADPERYRYLYTVEEVDALVQAGTPFRDAYHRVSAAVNDGSYTPPTPAVHTHIGSKDNLATAAIQAKWDKVWLQLSLHSPGTE